MLIALFQPQPVAALPAGFQEFYLPLPTGSNLGSQPYNGTYSIFNAIEPTIATAAGMHYIVGVTGSADNTKVYYDQWENGYGTGTSGADEVVLLNKGQTWKFESSAIPVPRGTTTRYDGGDRIFVSGSLLQLVVSTWTEDKGTVFADAWEVYPVKAWDLNYTVPVGENLASSAPNYRNFTYVFALILSGSNGNNITITDPVGPVVTNTTLSQGQTYIYEVKGAGTTITGSAGIQVQLMTGRRTSWEMRGYTITPRSYWGTGYYTPVPSWSKPTSPNNAKSDLFVYNPNLVAITINYEDLSGTGSFSVAAGKTKSYFDGAGRYIPINSGAYIYNSSGQVFWAIGAGDSNSPTWDWGYDLIPTNFLGTDNYVSWAPGNRTMTGSTVNGSPVYVTALTNNTTVFIDYGIPNPANPSLSSINNGIFEATYVLNRLQTIQIFDPDKDNTGMHIVSTAPVAVAWGESPDVAGTGDPYLDMGYTTLPLPIEWIDVALQVDKTANPTQVLVGQESVFTVTVSVPPSAGAAATSVNMVDALPAGWQYVTGSGSPADPTTITGTLAGGYVLTWNTNWTINPGASQTITFHAKATASADQSNPNRNVATATGQSLGATLTADDDAFVDVITPTLVLVKNGILDMTVVSPGGQADVGDKINYTFTVTNTGNVTLTNVTLTDLKVSISGGPIASLAAGATDASTFTGSYILTQDDIDAGKVDNTATVTGTPPTGPDVTNQSSKTVNIAQSPGIDVLKSGLLDITFAAPNGQANAGDKINYTFIVTNTGNVTLTNITLADLKVTVSGGPIASLAPGASDSLTFTGSYILTQTDIDAGKVDNTATATGTTPGLTTVTDQDSKTINIPQSANIDLVKNGLLDITFAAPSGQANPGDKISYSFTVTNTGNVTLNNVTLSDPLFTVSGGPISLAPGDSDSLTFTGSYILTQNDIDAGKVDNTATVTGTTPGNTPVTDQDSETVNIPQSANIDLLKSGLLDITFAAPSGQANPGDKISYSFTVTNTGNVTLTNITVADLKVTVAGGPLASLAPGASDSLTFTGSYILTQTDIDAGKVDNTATVTGTTPVNTPVTDQDSETVNIPQSANIDLVKNGFLDITFAAPSGQANDGDKISYTFTVTNTGNVTLTNVMVSDPLFTVSGGPISLAPGDSDSLTFTGSYILTQTDIDAGKVDNTATATGTTPDLATVTDQDSETVNIPQSANIDLLKNGILDMTVAGLPGQADINDVINYTFTVTNTGNVTLTNVMVTDPLFTVSGGPISLAPGDSDTLTFTGSHALIQNDITAGYVDNTATVTGTTPDLSTVTDQDSKRVPVPQGPNIDLVKNGVLDMTVVAPGAQANVDDKINYTFTVTNTGNVPLTGVTVTDPLFTVLGGPISLAVGESDSLTFTGSYNLTQTDINAGKVENTATATGTTPSFTTVSDQHSTTVDIPEDKGISLVKNGVLDISVVAPAAQANVDDKIYYTFTVTNTGNVPLTGVTVTDPRFTVSGGPISLAVGASDSLTFTGSYNLTQIDINAGKVVNTAKATGTTPSLTTVTDEHTRTVDVPQDQSIALVKSGVLDMSAVAPGAQANIDDVINYTFTVTNTGNVPLTGVTVTDPRFTVLGGPISLDPGDSDTLTFTGTYNLTQADINAGKVDNIATATGTTPSEDTVTDQHSTTVDVPQDKSIALVKSGVLDMSAVAPADQANVGDKVNYTFTVTNTGNVPLTGVTITDPKFTVIGGPISLAVGQSDSLTFTGSYNLTQNDINAGKVDNTATATGTTPDNTPVTDEHTKTVDVPQDESIELVKDGVLDMTVVPPVDEANVGDIIHYTFTVTNTGNVPLTNVTVTDPKITVSGGPISLAIGQSDSSTFTGSYTLIQADITAGQVDNNATATGTTPGNTQVSDEHSKTVSIPESQAGGPGASIEVVKVGVLDMMVTPPVIHYTFTVTNTGDVVLTGVVVTDPKVTVIGGHIDTLPVGASDSTTFTGTYTLTQADIDAHKVDNTAEVSAKPPSGPDITDQDTVRVTIPASPMGVGGEVRAVDRPGLLVPWLGLLALALISGTTFFYLKRRGAR